MSSHSPQRVVVPPLSAAGKEGVLPSRQLTLRVHDVSRGREGRTDGTDGDLILDEI